MKIIVMTRRDIILMCEFAREKFCYRATGNFFRKIIGKNGFGKDEVTI